MESCTAASTAKQLLRWCKTLGFPEVWVSDTASHFKDSRVRVEGNFAGTEARCS